MSNQLIRFFVGIFTLLLAGAGSAYAAQKERFVGEVDLIADHTANSLENSNTVSTGSSASSTGLLVAQNTQDNQSDSDTEENQPEQGESEGQDIVDQYSLPRSAAPVAVDQSLQTSSPVGENTQAALSRPSGVKIDSAMGFFPSLTIGVSRTENPARQDNMDDTEDTVVRIVPRLVYRGAIKNRHAYEIGVSASSDSFDDFSNLDSDTVTVQGAVKLDFTEKYRATCMPATRKAKTHVVPPGQGFLTPMNRMTSLNGIISVED